MNEKRPVGTRLTDQTKYRLRVLAALDDTSMEGELDKLINQAFKARQQARTLVDSAVGYSAKEGE